jgi:hypothetical protein
MRSSLCLGAAVALAGCASSAQSEFFQDPKADEGAGGEGASGAGKGGSGAGETPEPGSPTQLVSGPVALVGVTSDDWAVFRSADELKAVTIGEDPSVERLSQNPGSVLIRGRVVFNWADVDWTEGVGDLSVWTAESGAYEIGPTLYAEGLVAASDRGSSFVYTTNPLEETTDLVVASSDLSSSQVLIEGMGRGSETTCGPSLGFVGERLFVGWCDVGSRAGRIERYELVDGAWQATLIADNALPAWSADGDGQRVFYQSSDYRAYFTEDGAETFIDSGVSRGFMLPDGSAVLYTVGDQLRRTSVPEMNPIPIVTRGYAQAVAFSPNYDVALYSTTVTYEAGTRQDLRLVPTNEFNPEPIELVSEPVAALPRSSITRDGRFVLYLTDVTPSGGSLHVVAIDGTETMVLENVVEALAVKDDTVVFTDNSSDPDQYPVVGDQRVLAVGRGAKSGLLEAKIAEGRAFSLDASGDNVVFVRSGVDRDADDAERDGLFFARIR